MGGERLLFCASPSVVVSGRCDLVAGVECIVLYVPTDMSRWHTVPCNRPLRVHNGSLSVALTCHFLRGLLYGPCHLFIVAAIKTDASTPHLSYSNFNKQHQQL